MTEAERLVADYAGTGLTIGRHPMALRRDELAMRGVLRACDLRTARQGRRVRVAGMVITRQRPGTAKGFVFLTLEDETGIANIIVRPDLFARDRLVIVEEPFLLVDGVLQSQDGVTRCAPSRCGACPAQASISKPTTFTNLSSIDLSSPELRAPSPEPRARAPSPEPRAPSSEPRAPSPDPEP